MISKERLIRFLSERGITPEPVRDAECLDPSNRVAQYMVDNHERLRPFLTTLKRLPRRQAETSTSLDGLDSHQVEAIVHLGYLARDFGLFARFFFDRRRHRIDFQVQDDPECYMYLTGTWFERAVTERIVTLLIDRGADPDDSTAWPNVRVRLPDSGRFEFDLLIETASHGIIWIEAKSGDTYYSRDLPRYRRIARCLRLPPRQALLVTLDSLLVDQAQSLSLVSRMSVVPYDTLDRFFDHTLRAA